MPCYSQNYLRKETCAIDYSYCIFIGASSRFVHNSPVAYSITLNPQEPITDTQAREIFLCRPKEEIALLEAIDQAHPKMLSASFQDHLLRFEVNPIFAQDVGDLFCTLKFLEHHLA